MSASPLSRRGLITGLALSPLTALPAVAAVPPLPPHEAGFVAQGETLVALLEEYDRLWAHVHPSYEAAERAHPHRPWNFLEASPEIRAYLETRAPADAVETRIFEIVEPLYGLPLTSLPAILLRHRVGMTFEQCREDALDDLDRLWGRPCA
ncbi:UNVERIFIED_CONTAM: hypothetical protein Q9R58_28085 [Methylobacteriaceae bacterium AG10]|nr:hypothetical protein [Methylobacteriaceae bacterium AG10]